MRTPGIAGITSIECPRCGLALSDYDAPQTVHGMVRLTARCHACRTQEVFEVDQGRSETSVVSIRHSVWAVPD